MNTVAIVDHVIAAYRAHLDAAQPTYRFMGWLHEFRDELARTGDLGDSGAVAEQATASLTEPMTGDGLVAFRSPPFVPPAQDDDARKARYAAAVEKRKATIAAKKAAAAPVEKLDDVWGQA